MRSRKRSVRLKIFLLLVAPLISVVGLWAFAASLTVGDARKQLRTNTVAQNLAIPLAAVSSMLAPESLLSVVSMGTHSPADKTALAEQRARTDGAVAAVRATIGTAKVRAATSESLRREIEGLFQQMGRLAEIRTSVDTGAESRLGVITAYGDLVDAVSGVQDDVGVASLVDPAIYHQAIPLYAVGQGNDLLTREEAVLLGALAAGARSLDPAETMAFNQLAANRRMLLEGVAGRPDPALGTGLQQVLRSEPYSSLTTIENQIMATPAGAPLPRDAATLRTAAEAVKASYLQVTQPMSTALIKRASDAGRPVLIRLALVGGLGLVLLALSLLLSIRLARRLTRELTGLQDAARELADERLPRIIDRLRNDEPVDVDAEAPPLQIGETAEVAKVGEAFTTVQRTAVEAAIGQANLRRGVRQVFLNLARRSQSLLHRQLAMLDRMERKTTDPDELDELFRLDHLTTRMRRHAEGLIILSGAQPARAWSTPVRAVDVIRAAIAEVEGYTRVRVLVVSEATLVGSAVADLTHLIAELVENAASFSPPHTQVQVRAETVGNGFVVEIEDAGLGMTAEQLDDVNERLARPPDFDLADTDRLGLFVVAQLAARHRIRVTVRPSPYGGTTAIVLLPTELVAGDGSPTSAARPVGAAAATPTVLAGDLEGPALTGRHRRIAGFLQRTRVLQADELRSRSAKPPEWGAFDLWATARPAPDQPAGAAAAPAGVHAGLPRRVRRANLAPQLRDSPGPAGDDEPDGVDSRSPEQVRALMNTLQSGWQRGRTEAGPPPDSGETR